MANPRMRLIFCEILNSEMDFIKCVLEDIKQTYDSAKQSISNLELKPNELEEDGDGGYIDYNYYELVALDKLNRIKYGCFAVLLSATAENKLLSLCTTTGLIKIKVSETNPNKREIEDCVGNKMEEKYLHWGKCETLIKNYKKIKFNALANIASVRRFRELSNRFKHSNGRMNDSFAKDSGGNIGDEIPYESENWEEMICGCKNFLTELAGKMLT